MTAKREKALYVNYYVAVNVVVERTGYAFMLTLS
jgi:hypothetical protein